MKRLFAAMLMVLSAMPLMAEEKPTYVVHEWGTFSTFSGSNGNPLKFAPNDTDLPAFVYSNRRNIKGGPSDSLVSLETPVLYFYSDKDRTVSVHVEFPSGTMTDWYPAASRPPARQIRWDDFIVLKSNNIKLKSESRPSRYYAAREVDAQLLKVNAEQGKESEKFLFYRGVGEAAMPFEVRALGKDKYGITNTGQQAVPGYFVVHVNAGKVRFAKFGNLNAKDTLDVTLPAAESTVEKLAEAMTKLLTDEGLYEKEAKAMVKTWQRDWFSSDGTRVLYLLSTKTTDELLPMTITPKPEAIVRVLVGRHDVLTPEKEAAIDLQVKEVNGESNEKAKKADAELNKLGRYRFAAQTASEERLKQAGRKKDD